MLKSSVRYLLTAVLFSGLVSAQTGAIAHANAASPAPDFTPVAPAAVISPTPAAQPASSWKQVPGYLLQDQKAFWSSPFHMTKSDAKWWALFGAAGAGLIVADKSIERQLPNTPAQASFGKWGSKFGQIYTLGGIDAGLYGLGMLRHDERMRQTSILGAEALGGAFIIDTVIKSVSQRQRPTEGSGSGSFFSGKGRPWNSGSSFPSGHAIETWALASVIAHQYSDSRWVPIAAYGFATGVSLSRIAAEKHFPSDVLIGAAMGYFIGDYVTRHHGAKSSKVDRLLTHVQASSSGIGLGGSF